MLRFWDDLTGRGSTPPAADGARIDELFARASSEPEAAAATARFAHHLGAGLATLVNLFNPETIVLAGSVGESVRIVRGQLGHDAVALGAATLVVDHHLANGFKLTAAAPSTPQLAGTAA